MQPFTQLRAVAAPIDLPNVDTDRIIPARFLRKPRDTPGYADFLFHDVRYDGDVILGNEDVAFVGRGRLFYAPVEDLAFGFGLVLTSCVVWTWLGRRAHEEQT